MGIGRLFIVFNDARIYIMRSIGKEPAISQYNTTRIPTLNNF